MSRIPQTPISTVLFLLSPWEKILARFRGYPQALRDHGPVDLLHISIIEPPQVVGRCK